MLWSETESAPKCAAKGVGSPSLQKCPVHEIHAPGKTGDAASRKLYVAGKATFKGRQAQMIKQKSRWPLLIRLFDWPLACTDSSNRPDKSPHHNRTYPAAHSTDVSQTSASCAHGGEYAPPPASFASGFRNVRSVRVIKPTTASYALKAISSPTDSAKIRKGA